MFNLIVGIISIFVSVFAVVILYLTRANILDILDKDVILFDRNFELKKNVIDSALKLIDEIQEKGKEITLRPEVQQQAKKVYNDLLCVSSEVTVADEFYNITLENNTEVTETRLAQFKLMCRKDIGLKTKKARAVKRILEKQQATSNENETILRTNSIIRNQGFSNDTYSQIQRPKVEPVQPAVQPTVQQATQPRPTSAQQVQARPVQPAVKPAPVQPVQAQPVKRGRPKKTS